MTQKSFSDQLSRGVSAEVELRNRLTQIGLVCIPAGQIDHGGRDRGSRVFHKDKSYVMPDILAFRGRWQFFFECKSKDAPSWRFSRGKWEFGIDSYCWEDYLEIHKITGIPVLVVLKFTGSIPSSADRKSSQELGHMNPLPDTSPKGWWIANLGWGVMKPLRTDSGLCYFDLGSATHLTDGLDSLGGHFIMNL